MSEKQVIVTLEDGFGRVQTSIATSLSAPQLMEKIMGIDEQQANIEELRLQEKEKGVPVFVVRDGKNPIALFFNEQRASWYCQENIANLTYQQEKWCRVE